MPSGLDSFATWKEVTTVYHARDEAKARAGGAFSLKDFHSKTLSLGAMGLDPLRKALSRCQMP